MKAVRLHHAATIALGLSAALLIDTPTAVAQISVKAVFEKYNLLGTFAWDCSKPASMDNRYYVHRAINTDFVQRDQMSGPTTRDWVARIERAAEVKPNELAVSATFTGRTMGKDLDSKPSSGLWRLEPNRLLQWEATIDGQKVIHDGKLVSNGFQLPWASRCGD
jgi:hypothetical protein